MKVNKQPGKSTAAKATEIAAKAKDIKPSTKAPAKLMKAPAAEKPAKPAKAPAVTPLPPGLGPIKLESGEQWYVCLGAESQKGCALFLAKPTAKGFIPTRREDGTKVTCREVVLDNAGAADIRWHGFEPTPDACRAWVARRTERPHFASLASALKKGSVKALAMKANGNVVQVIVPSWWKSSDKLPLVVGHQSTGGRIEPRAHPQAGRNANWHAKLTPA